jgi:hypothetical protein
MHITFDPLDPHDVSAVQQFIARLNLPPGVQVSNPPAAPAAPAAPEKPAPRARKKAEVPAEVPAKAPAEIPIEVPAKAPLPAGNVPLEDLGAGPIPPPAAVVPPATTAAVLTPSHPPRTKEVVRTLLSAYSEKNGKEKTIKLLQDIGKANRLSDVQPLLYGDLIKATGLELAEAEAINAEAIAKATSKAP